MLGFGRRSVQRAWACCGSPLPAFSRTVHRPPGYALRRLGLLGHPQQSTLRKQLRRQKLISRRSWRQDIRGAGSRRGRDGGSVPSSVLRSLVGGVFSAPAS